jgi:hypothetical protein
MIGLSIQPTPDSMNSVAKLGFPDSTRVSRLELLAAAICSHNGTVLIQNSTFTNNSAAGGSTPIDHCTDASCTFAASGRGEGGAIFAVNGSLTIQYSTIAGNGNSLAAREGSGIVVDQESQVPTFCTLENSIVFNSSPRACFYSTGAQAVGAGNLITNNEGCPRMVSSASPLLGPLQRNSPGLTPTVAISTSRPALDPADPGAATSLTEDQRGIDRPQGNGFDIGAVEKCRSLGPILGDSCLIVGPISLVLDSLSANVTLFNASGITDSLAPPANSPYLNANLNLGPGQSVSFSLQSTDPAYTAIPFNTRVLAGPGAR